MTDADPAGGEDWVPCRLSQLFQSDPPAEAYGVVLREEDGPRAFPIHIGPPEWMAIHRPVHGQAMARPMTHDLLMACLEALGTRPEEVRVRGLSADGEGGGVFLGSLVLRRGDEMVEIDCRPSDALAVAVRCGCPIQVARPLLEQVAGDPE